MSQLYTCWERLVDRIFPRARWLSSPFVASEVPYLSHNNNVEGLLFSRRWVRRWLLELLFFGTPRGTRNTVIILIICFLTTILLDIYIYIYILTWKGDTGPHPCFGEYLLCEYYVNKRNAHKYYVNTMRMSRKLFFLFLKDFFKNNHIPKKTSSTNHTNIKNIPACHIQAATSPRPGQNLATTSKRLGRVLATTWPRPGLELAATSIHNVYHASITTDRCQ